MQEIKQSLEELLLFFDAKIIKVDEITGQVFIISYKRLPESLDKIAIYHTSAFGNLTFGVDGYSILSNELNYYEYCFSKENLHDIKVVLFFETEKYRYLQFSKQIDIELASELSSQ